MPITLIQHKGTLDMAEASYNGYNFNQVVNNSLQYLKKEYTAAAIAKEAMEKQEIEAAKAAIAEESNGFGTLTIGEKLAQAGIGKRVVQQIADTAVNAVGEVLSPLTEYLNKYEKIFDEELYKKEFNGDAFQIYSASQEMQKAASKGVYIYGLNDNNQTNGATATRFVMDM